MTLRFKSIVISLFIVVLTASHVYFSTCLWQIKRDLQVQRQRLNIAPRADHSQFMLQEMPNAHISQWRFYVYRPVGTQLRMNYAFTKGKQDRFPTPQVTRKVEAWSINQNGVRREFQEFFIDVYVRHKPEKTQVYISNFEMIDIPLDSFVHAGDYELRRPPTDSGDKLPTAVLRLASTISDEELVIWLENVP